MRAALPVKPVCDEPVCYEAPHAPDEVLYSGSDDEYYENPAERCQRYEAQAQRYLDGKPVHIFSASLRGPFTQESGWQNPWRSRTGQGKPQRRGPHKVVSQSTNARVGYCSTLDDSGWWDEPDPLTHKRSDAVFRQPEKTKTPPTQPAPCPLPSTTSSKATHTRINPYMDDVSWVRVRAWRDEVQSNAASREEFWVSSHGQADGETSARKRKASSSEWLRRTVVKRRRLETPSIRASPTPGQYDESLPSVLNITATPSSSVPGDDLPDTRHAGNSLRHQRSFSMLKSAAKQRLANRLAITGRARGTVELSQGRPRDFCMSEAQPHQRQNERPMGRGLSNTAVPRPRYSRDIDMKNYEKGEESDENEENDEPEDPISTTKQAINKGTESPEIAENDAVALLSDEPEAPMESGQVPEALPEGGVDEEEAVPEDGTGVIASAIDGPTLVPSSPYDEVEGQAKEASPHSEHLQVERQGREPPESGDNEVARDTSFDAGRQAEELREHITEITQPAITCTPHDLAQQLGSNPRCYGAKDNNEPPSSSHARISDGVYVALEQSLSTLEPHCFEAEESEETVEPRATEPEMADGTIAMELEELGLLGQETSKVQSLRSPEQQPSPQGRNTPRQQQSPWVEEVVDIPYMTSLADDRSTIPSLILQTLDNICTSERTEPLPSSRCFQPLTSPASNNGPLGTSNDNLPEQALGCDGDVTMHESQAHADRPSTPETKPSSLPTPDFTLSIKSLREFMTPSPEPPRQPKRVLLQNGQLPSTQILFDAALSNPWRSSKKKPVRHVSFAPLPGEAGESHRPRALSPPLNMSQSDLPAENTRFGKHFATVTRKGPQMRRQRQQAQRLLPSASQQMCASPAFDAMAEAFIEADQRAATRQQHEGGAGLEQQGTSSVMEEGEIVMKEENHGPDGVDDVQAVLENLDEFLDSFDVEVELDRARVDDQQQGANESPMCVAGLGVNMTSIMGVNVWE
ncbi:hypothetical protein QBC33DRAFT_455228 [Phialemonium atrogriseum]|uniref:Protamine P1 n=1 Tax=Phialemonium atrogriseum TaxID=1093897 RepID=A0AAJ0BYQ2_9PEZI|nr:uncharacterized protein QBC33DRAFT_455228 [Phialemonium atrogriseum]KAK1765559.1 hypothetical protein QBC33DRAFT_455228 [Phialemonium atrogriseum]